MSPRRCCSWPSTDRPRRPDAPSPWTGARRTPSRGSPMIGVGAQIGFHPPAEQFQLVRAVEDLGYDSVWCGDHISFHGQYYEALTLLAGYAAVTTRIKLGTGVYLLALRPAALAAKQTATV